MWQIALPGSKVEYSGTDGRYLIISDTATTRTIEVETGATLWQRTDTLSGAPVYDSECWYLPLSQSIEAVDPKTGISRWTTVGSGSMTELHVFGNVLVAACKNGSLQAIGKESGTVRWRATNTIESVLTYGEDLYIKDERNGIAAIDTDTGKVKWKTKVSSAVYPFHTSQQGLYAIDESAGSILLFDRLKGGRLLELEKIKRAIVASPSSFAYFRSWSYNGTALSLLHLLNAEASDPKPKLIGAGTEYNGVSLIRSHGSRLYVLDNLQLHMVDTSRVDAGWAIAIQETETPIEAGGVLYLVSNDGVRGLDRRCGAVVWERMFSGDQSFLEKDRMSVYIASDDTITRIGTTESVGTPQPYTSLESNPRQ